MGVLDAPGIEDLSQQGISPHVSHPFGRDEQSCPQGSIDGCALCPGSQLCPCCLSLPWAMPR